MGNLNSANYGHIQPAIAKAALGNIAPNTQKKARTTTISAIMRAFFLPFSFCSIISPVGDAADMYRSGR